MIDLFMGDEVVLTSYVEGEYLTFKRKSDGKVFVIIGGDNDDGYINNGIKIIRGSSE